MSEDKLPETIEEAVQWMLHKLDLENRRTLKNMPKSDLGLLHHGYGMGIRNALGLWGKNPALIQAGKEKGMPHPDLFSTFLIERLWEYLQSVELPNDTKSE
jgi:hypothetical protein